MNEKYNITEDCIPADIYAELVNNGWIVMKGVKPGDGLSQQALESHLTALYGSKEYNRARGSYQRISELVARHFFFLGRYTGDSEGIETRERLLFHAVISTYGVEPQRRMAIEEASELIEALVREDRGRANKMDVITEIADVLIMCEQLAMIYGEYEVDLEKDRKLARLAERLEGRAQEKKPRIR